MVYSQTKLKVIDNSGVSFVRCIQGIGKSPKKSKKIGSLLTCVISSVKRNNNNKNFKKGNVVSGMFVQSKKEYHSGLKPTGIFFKNLRY